MGHRRDLIVPIHDRRKRKRYLTLKNFGIFVIVMLVVFVAISTYSEMRSIPTGHYGRLFRREVPPPPPAKPMEVVSEAPVRDQTEAVLVDTTAREQWIESDLAPVIIEPVRGDQDVAIVGGANGVTVVRRERRRPELSGGFGR
jgi:hypothetical protein